MIAKGLKSMGTSVCPIMHTKRETRFYKAHYPAHYLRTSSQAELLVFTFFPSSVMTLLDVWSANGNSSALTSSKVNLLNDNIY